MAKIIFKSKKLYLAIIFLIAAAGSIFFFPMNIGGRYTCFYHRLFDPPQSSASVAASIKNQDNNSNYDTPPETSHQHSDLLDNYLHQYAFIWWGSVGVLAFCLYIFFKIRRNLKVNDSSLMLK